MDEKIDLDKIKVLKNKNKIKKSKIKNVIKSKKQNIGVMLKYFNQNNSCAKEILYDGKIHRAAWNFILKKKNRILFMKES